MGGEDSPLRLPSTDRPARLRAVPVCGQVGVGALELRS